MRLLEKRPLATWCFLFVASSFALFFCTTIWKWVVFALALVAGLLLFFLLRSYTRTLLCGICIALILSTLTSLVCYDFGFFADLETWDGKADILASGTVTEVKIGTYQDTCVVKFAELDGEAVSIKAQLSVPTDTLAVGDCITATVALTSGIDGETFSSRWYLLSDGILFLADGENITITDENHGWFGELFETIRDKISQTLTTHVGGDAADLVRGLLLGEGNALPAYVQRDFRRCGVSHLLAVSGLHLSILIGILVLLGTRILPSRATRFPLLVSFVCFFVFLVGVRASILRAGTMAILVAIAELWGRKSDSLTNLSMAAAGILLFSPTAILDLGYLLSCLATFGILALGAPLITSLHNALKKRMRKRRFLRKLLLILPDSLILTISATVFTLPICAFCFDSFALLTPLANLLFIPLATLVIWFAIPALLCGFLSPNVTIFATITRVLANALLRGVSVGASLVGFTVSYTIPALVAMICVGTALVLLTLLFSRHLKAATIVLCLCLLLTSVPVVLVRIQATDTMTVGFLPSKNGDVLLVGHGSSAVLMISGKCNYERLMPCLDYVRQTYHIDELSALVLLSPNQASVSDVAWVLSRFFVEQLVLLKPDSQRCERMGAKVAPLGTQMVVLQDNATEPFDLAEMQFSISQAGQVAIRYESRGVFYQPSGSAALSDFYATHQAYLSAVLLGGDCRGVTSENYLPPLIGLSACFIECDDGDVPLDGADLYRFRLSSETTDFGV